jgi:hypothetical protein
VFEGLGGRGVSAGASSAAVAPMAGGGARGGGDCACTHEERCGVAFIDGEELHAFTQKQRGRERGTQTLRPGGGAPAAAWQRGTRESAQSTRDAVSNFICPNLTSSNSIFLMQL